MRPGPWAVGLGLLTLSGAAASPASLRDQGSFEFYKARVPPVSDWKWYEGEPDCSLSPIGEQVDRVVRANITKNRGMSRLSSERLLTTRRNAFGPTLMDSRAIFEAAGRLVEGADFEVDFMSFAMEADSDPYREVVRGFERRLQSGRALAGPFRLRIYADHLSVMFAAGTARPKARSLLEPWLAVFRKYQLDPGAIRIEVYIHAHGAMLYHRGGRYAVHDKLLIVDGSYVHIGGANPQAKNNFAHPERDTAVVVKGEVATAAMDAFDSLWSRSDFSCTIEKIGGEYRPACADRPSPSVVEHSDAITAPRFERIGLSERACVPMILLSKGKWGYTNLEGYSNAWAKGLLAAVSASQRHVALSSPNMNAPPLQAALVDAMVTRDVRVRLLLPYQRNDSQVNSLGGFGSNAHSLRVMKACGLRARSGSEAAFQRFTRNFQFGWWVAEGETERFSGDGPGCFHTKFASFDDQALVVGSGNLDDQSFYHSSETSIFVDSAAVTRAVTGFVFTPEWDRAERFDLWKRMLSESSPGWEFPLEAVEPEAFGLCSGLKYSLK